MIASQAIHENWKIIAIMKQLGMGSERIFLIYFFGII